MPLVSVVTVTYNRAHLIGETIESVLNQSFRDFEYIIVDDGSDDGTEALVASIPDPRILFFKVPHTGRLSSLRNFGHTKCTGALIAYVDSDDIWIPDKLEKQVTAMQNHPTAGFSFTDIELFNDRGTFKSSIYNKQGTEVRNVFASMLANKLVICHTTLMVRRRTLDQVGESDETFQSGDHDFAFRLSREVDAIIHYEPLVRVRKHAQNKSSNPAYHRVAFEAHQRTLKKLFDSCKISTDEYQRAIQLTSYSFGSQSMTNGDYDNAIQYFKKSLVRKPWHMKTWIKLGLTLAKKVSGF
jgi:glycosyltransferase involved in cell wall biosynthesis